MACNLMNKIFFMCLIITMIIICTFSCRVGGRGGNFGSCIRTSDMEDAQGSYNNEDETIWIHVSMGNDKIESNGIRSKVEPMELAETMRSLH
jgi:hypothetical protein